MAKIKVHLLNFHGPFNSHIEIVLENLSDKNQLFYNLDRWNTPRKQWEKWPEEYIAKASSVYSFDIVADPREITESWINYWLDTEENARVLGDNCAVATQWFLSKFAGIPQPDSSNFSLNYLSCGIVWPSFIPCFVTLPGRILSNAKFHLEAKNNPEMAAQYNRLLEYTYKALAVLAFAVTSTLAVTVVLPLALAALTIAVAAALIIGSVVVAASNAYDFFKKKNLPKDIVSNNYFDDMDNFLLNKNARTFAQAA